MLIYHYKMRDRNEQKKRTAETRRKEGHEAEKKQETDYKALTVPELKGMAKEKNIEGYSTMKKNELVNALKEGD
jgi:alpha-galactosidase/6-phospho-beta-glucosidase family protein